MTREKLEKIIYGGMRKRLLEAEFQRRYATTNLFRPGADPENRDILAHEPNIETVVNKETAADIEAAVDSADINYKKADIQSEPTDNHDPFLDLNKTIDSEIKHPDTLLSNENDKWSGSYIIRPVAAFAKGDNIYTELLDYFHSNNICREKTTPVLEEDANCILMTAAGAARKSTVIFGESRTGKTLIADRFIRFFESVFELAGCSDKALTENAEIINDHDIFYSVEFQGLLDRNPHVREAFKCVSEDRDYSYQKNGRRVRINGDITIISTAATENRSTQKQDTEMLARFIQLQTRPNDKKKLDTICSYQDKLAAGEIEGINYSEERFEKLKDHINKTYYDTSTEFENPFAMVYGELYLPKTKKSVHYRTLYASMLNSFTKLNRQNRIMNKNNKLITSLEDVYLVHELYHKTYCRGLTRLATQSKNALLGDRGLTEEQKATLGTEYEDELEIIVGKMERVIDWEQLWSEGYERMRTKHPDILQPWVDSQSKNGYVVVYDPLKAHEVELCKK